MTVQSSQILPLSAGCDCSANTTGADSMGKRMTWIPLCVKASHATVCRAQSQHARQVGGRHTLAGMADLVRVLWWTSTAALVATFGYAAWSLPERVPMQVGFSGEPTSWDSKGGLLAALALGLGSALMMGVLARGIGRSMSLDFVNVPHKQRWLPGHEDQLRSRVATDLYAVGTLTSTMLAALTLGTTAIAHGSRTMPDWVTAVAVGCIVLLLVQIVVMVTVRYRSPD